jgi:hypothetical protein
MSKQGFHGSSDPNANPSSSSSTWSKVFCKSHGVEVEKPHVTFAGPSRSPNLTPRRAPSPPKKPHRLSSPPRSDVLPSSSPGDQNTPTPVNRISSLPARTSPSPKSQRKASPPSPRSTRKASPPKYKGKEKARSDSPKEPDIPCCCDCVHHRAAAVPFDGITMYQCNHQVRWSCIWRWSDECDYESDNPPRTLPCGCAMSFMRNLRFYHDIGEAWKKGRGVPEGRHRRRGRGSSV